MRQRERRRFATSCPDQPLGSERAQQRSYFVFDGEPANGPFGPLTTNASTSLVEGVWFSNIGSAVEAVWGGAPGRFLRVFPVHGLAAVSRLARLDGAGIAGFAALDTSCASCAALLSK